ncbi:MAG: hypothetical protein IJX98_03945 [Clostridia bacterium]|nr:hypothetical protein [Clostridia bacterium]
MKKEKKIQTRKALEWYLASHFLEMFRSTRLLWHDEKFQALFYALLDYANKQIAPTVQGDITDTFVIVEQTVDE